MLSNPQTIEQTHSHSNPNPAGWRTKFKRTHHAEPTRYDLLANVATVAPSTMRRAEALAPKVRETVPGVFLVGLSQVSTWHAKCTCKASRTNPKKPCVHQVAAYLAGKPITWGKQGRILRNYYRKHGTPPEIVAIYARVKGYRILETFKGGFYRIGESFEYENGAITYTMHTPSGRTFTTTKEMLYTITPFFVEGGTK